MSHTVNRRTTYNLLRLHERNFILLTQLIPALHELSDRGVSRGHRDKALHYRVLERSKYTTTIVLTQHIPVGRVAFPYPDLHIRIYHDAKVAEIVHQSGPPGTSWYGDRSAQSESDPDGKEHLNRFLSNWLVKCLEQGHMFRRQVEQEGQGGESVVYDGVG